MDKLAIVWSKPKPNEGMEIAAVRLSRTTLRASGCAIGVHPLPYQLEYDLVTVDGFVTSRLHVESRGAGWSRVLDLRRRDDGRWLCKTKELGEVHLPAAGGNMSRLTGALDCDLGLSPLTNSMPILRHDVHKGSGTFDFRMAWVGVPELTVVPSRQRYAYLRTINGRAVIRYSSGTFAADLRVDGRGIVLDYPSLARQILSRT
jgi:uncharacterized protein